MLYGLRGFSFELFFYHVYTFYTCKPLVKAALSETIWTFCDCRCCAVIRHRRYRCWYLRYKGLKRCTWKCHLLSPELYDGAAFAIIVCLSVSVFSCRHIPRRHSSRVKKRHGVYLTHDNVAADVFFGTADVFSASTKNKIKVALVDNPPLSFLSQKNCLDAVRCRCCLR